MEATLLLLVAGVGYVLSRRRHEPGRVPLTVPPVTSQFVSQDARAIEECDRPSTRDQYHATRMNDVLLAERREMARREMAGRETAKGVGGGGSQPYFHSSLSGVSTRLEHENMVPFFRGSEPPGSRHQGGGGDVGGGLLEGFAATRDVIGGESLSKGRREVRQLFDPNESRTNVLLRPGGVAAEYLDSLQRPRNRANELPFEQQRVGPIPEERMREMIPDERTIDELRPLSRPKAVLEGRLIPGSSASTRTVRPNAGVNTQSRPPPLVREQRIAEDFLGAGGVTQRPAYDKVNIVDRATQRETTAVNGYRGGAAPVQVRRPENRGTEQRALVFRTPLGELSRGPAITRVKAAGDYGRSAVGTLPSNGRTVASARVASLPGTLTTAVKALVAPVQDALRTTRKEEFATAPAEAANLVGAHGVPKLTVYDSQDVARTTLKEAGLHDGREGGMIAPTARRGPAIDPDSGARRTLRESTATNEAGPRNLFRGGVGQGEAAPDAPAATLKDALAEDRRGGGGAFLGARAGGYAHAVLDPPAATQRATLADSGSRFGGVGGSLREASGAYALGPGPDDIAATMRSTTLAEYFGASEGEVAQPASREDVRSVVPALAREASVMTGREFLGGGAKLGAGAHEMGRDTAPEDPLRDGAWRGAYMPPSGHGVGGGGGGGVGSVAYAGVNTIEPGPEARYTADRLAGDIEGHRVQGAGGALRPPQLSNDMMADN